MLKHIAVDKELHKRLAIKKIELEVKKVDEVIALALDIMEGKVKSAKSKAKELMS